MYGLLTELEAVNGMLLAIHEQPVNTLEDEGIFEMSLARQTLTEVSRAVQSAGWHYNTVRGQKLLPTKPQKEIVLPDNCIRADTTRYSALHDVVQRGNKLFSVTRNSFVFENPVIVDMVLYLPFDELIQPAREYIMIKATRRFQARVMGSQMVDHFSQQEEVAAKAVLDQAECDNADYNVLYDSPLQRYQVRRDRQ